MWSIFRPCKPLLVGIPRLSWWRVAEHMHHKYKIKIQPQIQNTNTATNTKYKYHKHEYNAYLDYLGGVWRDDNGGSECGDATKYKTDIQKNLTLRFCKFIQIKLLKKTLHWIRWTRRKHSLCHFGISLLCCGLCRGRQRWKRPKNANGMCHTDRHILWCSTSVTQTHYGAVPVPKLNSLVEENQENPQQTWN